MNSKNQGGRAPGSTKISMSYYNPEREKRVSFSIDGDPKNPDEVDSFRTLVRTFVGPGVEIYTSEELIRLKKARINSLRSQDNQSYSAQAMADINTGTFGLKNLTEESPDLKVVQGSNDDKSDPGPTGDSESISTGFSKA